MTETPRSFLASHRDDASRLVERAKTFSVQIPGVGKVSVPPPDRLAFYGGLGLLAAVSVIDWPVALAIGVGAAVVAHDAKAQSQQATAPAGDGEVKPAPQERQKPPAKAVAIQSDTGEAS